MHTQELQRQGSEKSGKVPVVVETPKKKEQEPSVEQPLEPHWAALIDGATD